MRTLVIHGNKINLLPLPGDGEEHHCRVCMETFDKDTQRRCLYNRCSHIACFKCARAGKTGCYQCKDPKTPTSEATSSTNPHHAEEEGMLPVNIGDRVREEGNNDDFLFTENDSEKKEGARENYTPVVGEKGQSVTSMQSSPADQSNWKCMYCRMSYPDKSSLGLHMREEHSTERPFNCDACNWCVITEADLINHKKSSHSKEERPYSCPICTKRFTRKFIVMRHIEKVHPEQIQLILTSDSPTDSLNCPTCKVPYEPSDNRESLRRKASYVKCGHICCFDCIISQEGCVQCRQKKTIVEGKEKRPMEEMVVEGSSQAPKEPPKKKQKLSSTPSSITSNKKKNDYHEDEEPTDFQTGDFQCPICPSTFFSSLYSRERHVERAHQDVVHITCTGKGDCGTCGTHFQSEKHSRNRMATYVECGHFLCLGCIMKENLNCSQCLEFEAVNESSETEDAGRLPGLSKGLHDQNGRFNCLICDHTFSKQLSFERHLAKMHGIKLLKLSDEEKQGNVNLWCVECQEQFGSSEDSQKAQFSSCGHILCLKCVWNAELGCGQCTLEKARNSRPLSTTSTPSASPSFAAKGHPRGSETKQTTQFRQEGTTIPANSVSSTVFFSPISPSPTRNELSFKDEYPAEGKRSRENGQETVSLVKGRNETFDFQSSQESNLDSIFSSPSSYCSSSSSPSPRNIKLSAKGRQNKNSRSRKSQLNVNVGIPEKKTEVRHGQKLTQANPTKQVFKNKKGLNKYRCNYCGETFSTMRDKSNHLQMEHANKRRFQCQVCKWRCLSKNDLQRHILTHTQERPHRCGICPSAFNRKFSLQTHYLKVHKTNPPM